MKKSVLLQSEFSHLIATLGHTDEVTICDAGLPIPSNVKRIDLALTHGVPSFAQTVDVFLKESQIEGVILANEFRQVSPNAHADILSRIKQEEEISGKQIRVTYLSHEDLKIKTNDSKGIVRTGECTPYANVIFQSGVTF
ncbi:D-ribose pyranase [Vibrio sp. S11_S32]|uniref:D-ribose pyranase n=1 Tax=Vibrio sp. S11_S32 TaxID=2720225 RepID=UPI00167FF34D|nr:D-ribose pyranase [Vibrio sp. S11_S32]MBD1576483.1 D-ribose pyranase [Vibrio sp. S11_S32]